MKQLTQVIDKKDGSVVFEGTKEESLIFMKTYAMTQIIDKRRKSNEKK